MCYITEMYYITHVYFRGSEFLWFYLTQIQHAQVSLLHRLALELVTLMASGVYIYIYIPTYGNIFFLMINIKKNQLLLNNLYFLNQQSYLERPFTPKVPSLPIHVDFSNTKFFLCTIIMCSNLFLLQMVNHLS